jgi:hypothetical protein
MVRATIAATTAPIRQSHRIALSMLEAVNCLTRTTGGDLRFSAIKRQ